MNDQIERTAVTQSNSSEMAHVARRQATDAESLRKRDDRAVHKAETKVLVAPVNLHCT